MRAPSSAEHRVVGAVMGRAPVVSSWATSLCFGAQRQQGQDQRRAGSLEHEGSGFSLSLLPGTTPGLLTPLPRSPWDLGGQYSLPKHLSSLLSPLGWPQWTTMFPGQEGDGSALSARATTPSLPFGVTQPCQPRSQGPRLATSCSGVKAGGPQGLLCAVPRKERAGLHYRAGRPPRAPPPPRAASLVRSSTPVGKLRPAWTLMNSHEE